MEGPKGQLHCSFGATVIIKFPSLDGKQQLRLPIEAVQQRIVRDFERGLGMRSVAKMYQSRVVIIEEILRERLRTLEQIERLRMLDHNRRAA